LETAKRIIGRPTFQAGSPGSSWGAFSGQQHYFAITRFDDTDYYSAVFLLAQWGF